MYEDNDEMGVTEYKDDIEHIFDAHKILVRIKRKNQQFENEYVQGDFLGLETNNKPRQQQIYIAISGNNRLKQSLEKRGLTSLGEVEYECIARLDSNVQDEDIIVYDNNNYLVKMDSVAEFKLNKAFVKFRILRQ